MQVKVDDVEPDEQLMSSGLLGPVTINFIDN